MSNLKSILNDLIWEGASDKISVNRGYHLPFKPNRKIKIKAAPFHKTNRILFYCIDWEMPIRTPILASKDGIILERESRFNTSGNENFVDRANYIIIAHENNEFSIYAHLDWRGINVRKGQKVKAGKLIGYSGQTGYATYPHLHFGVYKILNGKLKNIRVEFSTQLSKQ